MAPNKTGILKSDKVNIVGERRLGPGAAQNAPTRAPQGRIIEQSDAAAVVEVTCSCGRRLYLHCTYAGPATGAEQQGPPGSATA